MSKLLMDCGSLLEIHLGYIWIMCSSVVVFGFALGLHLGCVGGCCVSGLCWWVASRVVFGIASWGVGLSVVSLMMVVSFVVDLGVV